MNKKLFETTQSDLVQYNGKDFKVLRELEIGVECDFEVSPMYKIQFSDGFTTDAFYDEVYQEN